MFDFFRKIIYAINFAFNTLDVIVDGVVEIVGLTMDGIHYLSEGVLSVVPAWLLPFPLAALMILVIKFIINR